MVAITIIENSSFLDIFLTKPASINSENREMWEASMRGLQSLVRRTTPSSFAYLCEKTGNSHTDKVGSA